MSRSPPLEFASDAAQLPEILEPVPQPHVAPSAAPLLHCVPVLHYICHTPSREDFYQRFESGGPNCPRYSNQCRNLTLLRPLRRFCIVYPCSTTFATRPRARISISVLNPVGRNSISSMACLRNM